MVHREAQRRVVGFVNGILHSENRCLQLTARMTLGIVNPQSVTKLMLSADRTVLIDIQGMKEH